MGLFDDDFDVDPCVDVSIKPVGAVGEVIILPMPGTPYVGSDGDEYKRTEFSVGPASINVDMVMGVIRYRLRRIPLSKLSSSIEQVCRQSIHRHVRNCFNIKEISATEWRVTGRITKYSKPCGFAIKIIG